MIQSIMLAIAVLSVPGDEPSITLADLPNYRAALEGPPAGEAEVVTFQTLWDRPEEYRGHHLRVEGRVVRRFQQPTVGTFPPLTELWVATAQRDPFCLVFP